MALAATAAARLFRAATPPVVAPAPVAQLTDFKP
jgi:hypothetical protein